MKVVYVTDARLPTSRAHGAQVVRNCEALARVGADVTLVYQKVGDRDETAVTDYYEPRQEFQIVGMPGFDVPWLRSSSAGRLKRLMLSGYRAAWETAVWLRVLRIDADLFVMRNSTPILAWHLARAGRPTLIEFHSVPKSLSLRFHRSVAGAKGLKATLTVTEALGRSLEDEVGLSPALMKTLHDGVDLQRFAVRDASEADEQLDVVYVGSLLPNRGVGTLVEAAGKLPDTHVTIVGGVDPELSALKDAAAKAEHKNVRFLGHVPPTEVPPLLSRARVAVLPMTGKEDHTRLHASPLKLFEYMASGLAIVASDLPSVREVVKHGVTAHLVAPDDAQALADGIKHVLGDEEYAQRLGDAARKEVQQYTWENRARSMLAAAGLSV